MEIKFADSFYDSLKVLARQSTWWYKTYKFLRWDIKHFIQNVWTFRKELWDHRWWDYRFTLNIFERSLDIQEKGMSTKGYEVPDRFALFQLLLPMMVLIGTKVSMVVANSGL